MPEVQKVDANGDKINLKVKFSLEKIWSSEMSGLNVRRRPELFCDNKINAIQRPEPIDLTQRRKANCFVRLYRW